MTNRFFNNILDLLPFTRARSGDVEANFDAVTAGFDAVQVELNAAMRLPNGETMNRLPNAATRAGTYPYFDTVGALQVGSITEVPGISAALSAYMPLAGGTLNGVLSFGTAGWTKAIMLTPGVTAQSYLGYDGNALNLATNANFSGTWATDDATKKKFAYLQHMGSGRHEFRAAPIGSTVAWVTSLAIDDLGAAFAVPVTISGNQVWHAGNLSFAALAAGNPATSGYNFDGIKQPGLYHYDGGVTGTKPPDAANNYRVLEMGGPGRYSQIAQSWNADNLYFRRQLDTGWGGWRTIWHDGNLDSSLIMSNRGTIDSSLQDSSTANGYYQISYSGFSKGMLSFNPGGSCGPVQMLFTYQGDMQFRNKTDSTNWTAWKGVWTTANFNPSGYLPLSGGTVSGNLVVSSNLGVAGYVNPVTIFLNTANTALTQGGNSSLHLATPYGYVEIGAQNGTYCHFVTDRPAFYFTKFLNTVGLSTSWGITNGENTGAFNAIMGLGSSATWLLSGSSGGVCRGGIQMLDAGGTMYIWEGANAMTFSGGTLSMNALTTTTSIYTGGTMTSNAVATNSVATGTLSATSTITASGAISSGGNVSAYSDRRLKKDIAPIKSALAKLLMIFGVTWTRKDTGERGIGVIAQDVLAAGFPEAVTTAADGTLGVAYGNMVGPIIEAIRELSDRIDRLERMEALA